MRKARLRWFGHMKRRCTYALVRRCERLTWGSLARDRDRTKKFRGEMTRQGMTQLR